MGDGTTRARISPIRIGSTTDWKEVTAGSDHSVALKLDGSLWAWGNNFEGQLGDGTTGPKYSPVRIDPATDWKEVTAGYFHTFALKTDGSLWAWGSNGYGQLGDGWTIQIPGGNSWGGPP